MKYVNAFLICSTYKKKITYDVMTQLAQSLLDDTVFEIVKGLEDIQQLTERNLLNRRMKVLSDHKGNLLGRQDTPD